MREEKQLELQQELNQQGMQKRKDSDSDRVKKLKLEIKKEFEEETREDGRGENDTISNGTPNHKEITIKKTSFGDKKKASNSPSTSIPCDLEVSENLNTNTKIRRKTIDDANCCESSEHNSGQNSGAESTGDDNTTSTTTNNKSPRKRDQACDIFTEKTHTGSCFCGAVKFEFRSRSEIKCLVNCSCQCCLKYMDPCLYIKGHKFKVLEGEDKLTTFYVGDSGVVSNHFCSICGVKCFRKIVNAPTKIANVLIRICGSESNLEEDFQREARVSQSEAALSNEIEDRCDVIGVGNVDGLDGSPIKYGKVIKCDMTKVTWEEMKRLLFV